MFYILKSTYPYSSGFFLNNYLTIYVYGNHIPIISSMLYLSLILFGQSDRISKHPSLLHRQFNTFTDSDDTQTSSLNM